MNNRTEEKLKDLSRMQKAVSELLQQAWERGYKYCEAEHEEQTKKDHGFSVGDVVYYSKFARADDRKGIIIGFSYRDGEKTLASVYMREFGVPQILPLTDLTPTGQHVNVLDFFNKAFIDISGGEEND
jgi:hypothetical protein